MNSERKRKKKWKMCSNPEGRVTGPSLNILYGRSYLLAELDFDTLILQC